MTRVLSHDFTCEGLPKTYMCHIFVPGSLKDLKPANWCLSEDYLAYLTRPDENWTPNQDYYVRLIGRLVDRILSI